MRWYADDKGVIFHCKCHWNVIIRTQAGGGAMQQRRHGCWRSRRSARGATSVSAAPVVASGHRVHLNNEKQQLSGRVSATPAAGLQTPTRLQGIQGKPETMCPEWIH